MQIPASAAAPPSETTVWAHWAVAGHGPWLCGIQAQLPLLGVMTGPLLVLWASLVSVELTRGLMATVVPARNLSCFQCFKVRRASLCHPMECQPSEKVCVSNEVLLYTSTKSRTQISKRCAITCPNSNDLFEWSVKNIQARITRRCCSWDHCNRAPDSWEGFRALPGRLLLPMGLGLFCILL